MADIMLIDDERDLLEGLQEILADSGYSVFAYNDSRAAFETIRAASEPPALVITDVVMPGMTGLELLKASRALPDWDRVPFIFLSAASPLNMEGKLTDLAHVTYLCKPFSVQEFCEMVDTLISGVSC